LVNLKGCKKEGRPREKGLIKPRKALGKIIPNLNLGNWFAKGN